MVHDGVAAGQMRTAVQSPDVRQGDRWLTTRGIVPVAVFHRSPSSPLSPPVPLPPPPPPRSSELFSERLDDQELDVLEHALDKVTPVCSFG